MQAGTKCRKTPDEIKAKIVRYLVTSDAEKLKRCTAEQIAGQVSQMFSWQVATSTIVTLCKSLGIELKGTHRRNASRERSTFGNARRIMYLAREVKNLFKQLGVERSPMLERLCGGLEVNDPIEVDPT